MATEILRNGSTASSIRVAPVTRSLCDRCLGWLLDRLPPAGAREGERINVFCIAWGGHGKGSQVLTVYIARVACSMAFSGGQRKESQVYVDRLPWDRCAGKGS